MLFADDPDYAGAPTITWGIGETRRQSGNARAACSAAQPACAPSRWYVATYAQPAAGAAWQDGGAARSRRRPAAAPSRVGDILERIRAELAAVSPAYVAKWTLVGVAVGLVVMAAAFMGIRTGIRAFGAAARPNAEVTAYIAANGTEKTGAESGADGVETVSLTVLGAEPGQSTGSSKGSADVAVPTTTYAALLDADELAAYGAIYNSLLDGTLDGDGSDSPAAWDWAPEELSLSDLSTAYDAVVCDYPYLSCVTGNSARTIHRNWLFGTVYSVQLDDASDAIEWADGGITPDEAILACKERALSIAERCKAQAGGDERELVERVYTELSGGIAYADGDGGHTNDAYGALVLGESKCWGMSCAMKAVLDYAGVESAIVIGERSGGGGHAWNIVKVDGTWYACDVTNGSCAWAYGDATYDEIESILGEQSLQSFLDSGCLMTTSRMESDYVVGATSKRMLGWD